MPPFATDTDKIAPFMSRSINDPQRRRNRQTPTGNNSFESSEQHAATDSSTNTEERPNQPRQGFGHPQVQIQEITSRHRTTPPTLWPVDV